MGTGIPDTEQWWNGWSDFAVYIFRRLASAATRLLANGHGSSICADRMFGAGSATFVA
jgi:hypothetical protein